MVESLSYPEAALDTGERGEEDVLGDVLTGGESDALCGDLVCSTGAVVVAVTHLALVYTQTCSNHNNQMTSVNSTSQQAKSKKPNLAAKKQIT